MGLIYIRDPTLQRLVFQKPCPSPIPIYGFEPKRIQLNATHGNSQTQGQRS